jgi:hypothetical protein
MAISYIFWPFGILFQFWYVWIKKYLATCASLRGLSWSIITGGHALSDQYLLSACGKGTLAVSYFVFIYFTSQVFWSKAQPVGRQEKMP